MFPLSWCIVKAGNASLYTRPSSKVGSQVACQVASFTRELCFDVVDWIMSRICFPYGPGISCTCDQHRRILGCVPAHDEQVLPAPDRPALQAGNPHWPTEILLTLTIIFRLSLLISRVPITFTIYSIFPPLSHPQICPLQMWEVILLKTAGKILPSYCND